MHQFIDTSGDHVLHCAVFDNGPKGPPSAPPTIPPIIINPFSRDAPLPSGDPTPRRPPLRQPPTPGWRVPRIA